ncbi:SusC/RagA family TonB-linked outer membrane protein [Chitinophaga rhizophila]|uniref:TonB-dependent receptor n=1 Tax=Chitinophaga rhizophila TaxID=2866212 RepID=A0ABS7G7V6_9BACT|nr:hypothetical protein [Chitinophaga rhizophila]MBW8683385.1 hypothetical protein [Chitinophaga rhizophila]
MKYILLLLLLPTLVSAQVYSSVDPVLSKDYAEQLRKLRSTIDPVDSLAYKRNTILKLKGQFTPGIPISRMKVTADNLQISPSLTRYITIGTIYSGTIELKTHNRLPKLQDTYVQGSPVNGAPAWRGAETGELFSYGPALSSLEYDGSSYPFDQHGKLVPSGTGNGRAADNYPNDILRAAVVHSHNLSVRSELFRYGKRNWNFDFTLGRKDEKSIIRENKSVMNNLRGEIGTHWKWLTITGNYIYKDDTRTHGNRNGLLNRTYQYAMLTPVSFDNEQGSTYQNMQRSFSDKADNPFFLLHADNSYKWSEQNGSLTLNAKKGAYSASVSQALQNISERNRESYTRGTAGWPEGMYTDRRQKDLNYLLQADVTRDIQYAGNHFSSEIKYKYSYGNSNTRINYQSDNTNYRYNRSSHDMSLVMHNKYWKNNFTASLNAGNNAYMSNTITRSSFFLPALEAGVIFDRLLNMPVLLKVTSNYHTVNSELPINRSLAYTNLLQYTTDQSQHYRPTREIASYDELKPIRNREWSNHLTLIYRSAFSLDVDGYIKSINDDIFPQYQDGKLLLKNMANVRTSGIEVTIQEGWMRGTKAFNTSTILSFHTYRTAVIKVHDGYNYTPIAGFRNVHKTLIEGQPLGVITGSSYQRDNAGNIIIGPDGFPLVDNSQRVIGNPIPDFVLKLGESFHWKNLSLQTDLEWKKGGQTWNGTQAVLDYYGRSAVSGEQRNVSSYVFEGITADGHRNETPVTFYDPSKPVTSNRWTRYGLTGVTEAYVQKADYLRFNTIHLSYRQDLNKGKQRLTFATYVNNILLWSPYKGADTEQLLFDQANTSGLDFFNLLAMKTYGFNVTYQF